MRRFTNLLVIATVAALAAGRAWPTDIETLPEFMERVELETRRLAIRPDGSVASDQWTQRGTLGYLIEHPLDPLNPSRIESRGKIPPSTHGWESKGRVILRSLSEFIPGKGIMLHLTWLRDGKITGSEDALMEDFGPITRTLFVEPRTGLKHVVRFTPISKQEEPSDPMQLDWGGPLLRKFTVLASGGARGEKIFVNLPGTGFFQFALRPFTGAEPQARIKGNVLSFRWQGEDYSWYGAKTGLGGGPWRVYMLASETIPADILRTLDAHDTSNVMFGAMKID